MIKLGTDAATRTTMFYFEETLRVLDVEVLREIARGIAEKFIAEHYQEIAARMSQDAIATLAVAESAAAIRKTLAEKIPDKVLEVVTQAKPEVYQRGILGGLRHIL